MPPSLRRFIRPDSLRFCAVAAVLAGFAFVLAYQTAKSSLLNEAGVSAQARVQALESSLAVQRAVAGTLADDGLAQAALRAPEDQALAEQVSRKLEYLRHETGSNTIYLLDTRGITLSASNWREKISFVGGDYSFRSYFLDAVKNGVALEYGLGRDSNQPGLYLSHDIRKDGELLGVIVVKMLFDAMEASWARSHDLTYLTDETGRVLLSSDPGLRFGPAPDTPPGMFRLSEKVKGTPGWPLILHTPARFAWQIGAIAAAAVTLLAAVLLTLRQRQRRDLENRQAMRDAALRYQRDLEQAVADRTFALKSEMEERHQAEERLARMQGELVQANKLATLGQVTAGLAHEVNQPLATIRLLADNGKALLATDPEEAGRNLDKIAGMTERIDRITRHLRGFARKATGELRAVGVKEAIEASVLLTASRRRVRGAKLIITGDDPGLMVRGEAVRVEQVLVNLIQNAQEALFATPDPQIRVTVTTTAEEVLIEVADNGPGISAEMSGQIFMPFVTSKSEGLGLGLVIARDIARDLGGDLVFVPADTGAVFQLRMQRA